MKTNLIMPMGGAGTRFLNNGYECPKPLIDLNGQPFFKWACDSIYGQVELASLTFVVLQDHIDRLVDALVSLSDEIENAPEPTEELPF